VNFGNTNAVIKKGEPFVCYGHRIKGQTKGQTICGKTSAIISAFNYESDAVGRQISRTGTTQSLTVTNAFGYNLNRDDKRGHERDHRQLLL